MESKKKNTDFHFEGADEIINAITEILIRASGEEIEHIAKEVGLSVEYVGDSIFKVKE
jgi:hypothetical protein